MLRQIRQGAWIGLLVLLGLETVSADERQYAIDPVHSSVQFSIQYLYSQFFGRLNDFGGDITGDVDKPETLAVKAWVNVASIDTANSARDTHLRSADFFLTETYARAEFTSRKVVCGAGKTGQVSGDLVIRGVTNEVTFVGRFLGHGPDHKGMERIGLQATARINRQDFGVSYPGTLPGGLVVVGDDVELILNLSAVAAPEPVAAPATDD